MKREFVRFLVVGTGNTLAGLLVIFAMKALLGANDIVANATGYLVGLSLGFTLNRLWTFRHRGVIAPAAVKFAVAFLLAYGINLAVVMTLIHNFGVNSFVAQALGVPPYTIVFFLLSKLVVFRPSKSAPPSV